MYLNQTKPKRITVSIHPFRITTAGFNREAFTAGKNPASITNRISITLSFRN